jgi:hypothetical protein
MASVVNTPCPRIANAGPTTQSGAEMVNAGTTTEVGEERVDAAAETQNRA